jgi:hypothetical protein
MMTGHEHWAMTAFCAFSLIESTQAALRPIAINDGTLQDVERSELQRILPEMQILEAAACKENVRQFVPEERFPALHAIRRDLPLMRKLLDLHAGGTGWRLFLDSDMLFFREPAWMLQWLSHPKSPVHMWDYQNSYGYSLDLLDGLISEDAPGRTMPHKINTGFCGLRSDEIDWPRLEFWGQRLLASAGINHFTEQCLTAMLMAPNRCAAPPADYLILPTKEESQKPTAAMHHYVAESRTWYHIYGWPSVLAKSRK